MQSNAIGRLVKNSLIYGIGGMLQRFMGLVLLPFFTEVLTPQDYGIVALVALIGVAMSGFFTLGTGSSMGVIYYRETIINRRPTIIWTNTILLLGNGILWYSILFYAAPKLSELMFHSDRFGTLIRISLLGSVLAAITDPLLAYLRMEEKAKRFVFITLFHALLTISLSIWLVLELRMGVEGVIWATTLSQVIILIAAIAIIGRELSFNLDFKLFGPLVKIGYPVTFGMFAFLLIDYSNRQMIERFVNLELLGIYSVGYSFGIVMSVAVGAFATAWPPFFMSYINKSMEACIIFGKVLNYYLIIFGGLVVLFFALAKPMTALMTASEFHDAYLIVGLIAASLMLKGCYLIALPGIYFAEKLHKQSLVEWVVAIISIGLNLVLIPTFGIVGAAVATLLSYLMLPVLAWVVARNYLEVVYDWNRVLLISVMTVSASAFFYWLSVKVQSDSWFGVLVSVILVAVYCVGAYHILLTPTERNVFRNIVFYAK